MLRFDNNYRIVGTGLYGLESYILMKFLYSLLSNVGGNSCIPIFCFDFGLNYDGEVVIVYLSENSLDTFDYRADAINLHENIFHKNISNKKLLYLLGYNLYKSIKIIFDMDKCLSDKVDLFGNTSDFTRLRTYFDSKLLLISDLVFLDKASLDMEVCLGDIIFVLYKLMDKTDNRLKLDGDLISQKNLRWCKRDYNPIMLEINRIKYELMGDCIEKYYMLNHMYITSLSRPPKSWRRDNNMCDVNVDKIMTRMGRELLYIYNKA